MKKCKLSSFLTKVILAIVFLFLCQDSSVASAKNNDLNVVVIEAEYDEITPLSFGDEISDKYFLVKKAKKYGVIDWNGNILVPCKYSYQGANDISLGDKHGAFLKDGTFIEPISEVELQFEHGYSVIRVDDKFGVIDEKGKVIIEPKYIDCFIYDKEHFAVKSLDSEDNELWGIINTKEEYILQPALYYLNKDGICQVADSYFGIVNDKFGIYLTEYAEGFQLSEGVYAVRTFDDEKWGVIDSKGEIILKPQYDMIESFEDTSYEGEITFEGIYKFVAGKKYGFMNQYGKVLIKPQFYQPSGNEYYPGWRTDELCIARAKVGEDFKEGLVNGEGKLLLKPIYDSIVASWYHFDYSKYIAAEEDNTWKIFDKNGKYLFKVEKGYKVTSIERKMIYVVKDGKYYILDNKTGKHVQSSQFDGFAEYNSALYNSDQYEIIYKNNKYGLINNELAKVIFKPVYKYINTLSFDGKKDLMNDSKLSNADLAIIVADQDSKCSLYNLSGKLLKKTNYTNMYDFVGGYSAVVQNGKIGFINKNYKLAVSIKYESARPLSEGLIAIKSNGKWGYINTSNKIVIKPIYDAVGDFKDGLAPVKKGTKYGFIDKKGKIIVNIKYTNFIETFTNGFSPIVRDSKLYIINHKGSEVYNSKVNATELNTLHENKIITKKSNPVSVYTIKYKEKFGLCIIK